ncbi:MAG: GH36-type glycosyl hydrolase domain-containing protein, partial [Longimicrobiaceae bacterium]
YDDYPSSYLSFARRKHRWIRGDWQLLRWLRSPVPGPDGPEQNRLSPLSRWKIFDNLRRSVVEVFQLALLAAGWTVLPDTAVAWTLLGLVFIAFPWIFPLLVAAVTPPRDRSWRAYYAAVGREAIAGVQQFLVTLVFLPHQAWVSLDAIVRTLHRLHTGRKLLEWQTASQVERVTTGAGREIWRAMFPATLLAAAIGALVVIANLGSGTLAVVLPLGIVLLWLGAPLLARALRRPAVELTLRLTEPERDLALGYALLHWRFFERFVTPDTQWLAPDNYQEDPEPVVAPRTSPTNVGLQLLATVSAWDLGFVTLGEMILRLERAFGALERMERFRGHFYNWYELHELRVLQPAYISTVDSGNLAGHLIALKQACLGMGDEPLRASRSADALRTGLELAKAELRELGRARLRDPAGKRVAEAAEARVDAAAARLRNDSGVAPDPASAEVLEELRAALGDLGDADDLPGPAAEARHWLRWALRVAERWHDELAALAPGGAEGAPTLRELAEHSTLASQQVARLEILASRAEAYALEMDFRFLFDERQKLFSIGFQHSAHSYDPSYYDLLASEARLASFIAIAKGDVPPEHWFRLGRSLVGESGATALVSWSGSMFEYLMPLLVMQSFPNTLLDLTYRGALRRQIAYGGDLGTPWGVSESAYNLRDRSGTYQYRAFGVPDLALKRGLSKDLVVAPYASLLAMLVAPTRALRNLRVLERTGALGPYGFRDAVDYTRPAPGSDHAVVGNYMAHHIGMSLLALANALHDRVWQRRFHADPLVSSAELVLYERIPRRVVLQKAQPRDGDGGRSPRDTDRPAVRQVDDPDTPQPRIGLLGAEPYAVLLTHAGGGYSRAGSMAVTRWRADGTRDSEGQWVYLRDVASGRSWSGGYQPTGAPAESYRATFAVDRVTFRRRDGDLETCTEIAVVADDAAEVRRITLTNLGDEPHTVEVTSYGEIVLQPPDADRAHPAFGNLFVETEWVPDHSAVVASRRPRSGDEPRAWCAHVAAASVYAGKMGAVSCETDRARFVGRGRSTRDPAALDAAGELSGTVGAVLDPIFALRVPLAVMPGETARVAFTTLVAPTRERALELADRYCDLHAAQRALDLSWTHAQVELRDLMITPAEAALYQQLAGHLFFAEPAMRPPPRELGESTASRATLWGMGISGDWPILLAMIHSEAGIPSVRRLLQAHHYWRLKGVTADLVILNTHASGYLQELGDALLATVVASSEAGMMDKPGGVFIRRADLLSAEELSALRTTARVHVQSDGIGLGDLLDVPEIGPAYPPLLEPTAAVSRPRLAPRSGPPLPELRFDNGLGGVNGDGDYEIRLDPGEVTPAPWANVVANPVGGFCVTERGGGFSWAENSYFFRLTPWRNDPVTDLPGEILYLRDDASGEIWGATPAPVSDGRAYRVRHRAGASSFEHDHDGIVSELTIGMAEAEPVKISRLVLTNRGETARTLTLTSYVEWTLGVNREHTQHQLCTSFDSASGALFARNAFEPDFADMTAFSWIGAAVASYTADRREFLGRNGAPGDPAALRRTALAEATGAGLDPCAALQTTFVLEPGERREIVHLLGAAEGDNAARALIDRFGSAAGQALEDGTRRWRDRLGTIQVHTPDPACDALINGWALYQALSCRMWARSALYQSSGAYGFRDQLQDGMAFVYAEPAVTREHIVRASGRQFLEGDVQHWWHPHTGRGVRTRFSDDLVWLPFTVEHYVETTGDRGVLDEPTPYLKMRELKPGEEELYELPEVSEETGSVYEHCVRALDHACTGGRHGLPLIGGGDWNDGMNRVGIEGRGESVWLAWFLIATLRRFAVLAEARGDAAVARRFRERADGYAAAAEEGAWDGDW